MRARACVCVCVCVCVRVYGSPRESACTHGVCECVCVGKEWGVVISGLCLRSGGCGGAATKDGGWLAFLGGVSPVSEALVAFRLH